MCWEEGRPLSWMPPHPTASLPKKLYKLWSPKLSEHNLQTEV